MPIYTLIATHVEGHQHVTAAEFPDDAAVMEGAKNAVSTEHPSIALARGSGDNLEFMGVLERCDDGSIRWTPED